MEQFLTNYLTFIMCDIITQLNLICIQANILLLKWQQMLWQINSSSRSEGHNLGHDCDLIHLHKFTITEPEAQINWSANTITGINDYIRENQYAYDDLHQLQDSIL